MKLKKIILLKNGFKNISSGIKFRNSIHRNTNNILKFNYSKSALSDKDIVNLFMGFVKLIRRNAETIAEQKYKNIINELKIQIKNDFKI